MNKQVTIIPNDEELQLIQIKREQNALALKEALIKQKSAREVAIKKERERGDRVVKEANDKNDAIQTMMYNLNEHAGKGIYEVVKKDSSVQLKCYDHAIKQSIEGGLSTDWDKRDDYFIEQVDYQDHHIRHIVSGKTIYPQKEDKGIVFTIGGASYGRKYTRAKKLHEIISEEHNSKVSKETRVVTEAQEQELLYNMCQRAYPQATQIQKFKEPIYRFKGNRRNDREYVGDRLLVVVTFKSNLIINCTYGKPIKEEDKASINIYSRDVSKLTTEELLKHFGK